MSRTTKRSSVLALVAALAAAAILALTMSSAGAASKVQVLHISAKPGMLAFNTKTLKAKPGKVEIIFTNPKGSKIPHGFSLEGNGIDKDGKVIQGGKTADLTVTLKKGKYTFYCPVPGHEMAGMKGTLTVS
jgi:uncharacterized cupredoxin-like copper-binding protein